jgi:hypothetical protein
MLTVISPRKIEANVKKSYIANETSPLANFSTLRERTTGVPSKRLKKSTGKFPRQKILFSLPPHETQASETF